MIAKKSLLFGIIFLTMFTTVTFPGCGKPSENQQTVSSQSESQPSEVQKAEQDIYDFASYENDEVYNIRKVKLSDMLASNCETYQFTYRSDSYEIKAYVSFPTEKVSSKKPCKCILYNRGGNSNLGKLEDDDTARICLASQRIVVASEIRGSNGSGGTDEFGGSDLNDVIKMIDLCENYFDFVDMNDFCVAGISRGGMMTYMTAKQDSRVKRIIAISAVSDLFRSYEEREDMRKMLYECIGCTPEDDHSAYEKRSASYWADEIKIPVLIIHSKQDERVSYQQAEEMYNKLKDHTDCTLISRDDNVHGIHQEDFRTILEWLTK